MRGKASYLAAFNARRLVGRKLKNIDLIVVTARRHRQRRNLDRAGIPRRPSAVFQLGPANWKNLVQERKSNPEAKRARHDKVFRAKFLKRLRDQKRRLLCPPVKTCAAVTAWHIRRGEKNAKLCDIADQQSVVFGRKIQRTVVPRFPFPEIHRPISDRHDLSEIAERVVKVRRRGKEWDCQATFGESSYQHIPGASKYTGRKTWRTTARAVNSTALRLFAVQRSERVLECAYGKQDRLLTLPEGYAWEIQPGISLRLFQTDSPRDDYHLTAGDVATATVEHLLAMLAQNKQRRIETSAREAAFRAEQEGVFVCLRDSTRAGNCVQGSLDFARRHSIDANKHYAALQLLDMANGDAGRVRLAITAASIRHKQEMERGFSNLEDHTCLS